MAVDITALNEEIFAKHSKMTLIDGNDKLRKLTIDGPISSLYEVANTKILWVLREPHGNGGGSLISDVNDDLLGRDIPCYKRWYSSWGLIIKVSDAILNNLSSMSDTPPSILRPILRNVAVINLNKFGGGKKLSKHYLNGFKRCKEIVDDQVAILAPDIIIYAGTGYPATSLGVDNIDAEGFSWPTADNFPSIKKIGRVHIFAYHTGQRKIKHEKYCKQVIEHLR